MGDVIPGNGRERAIGAKPLSLDDLVLRLQAVEEKLVDLRTDHPPREIQDALSAARPHPAHTCVMVGKIVEWMFRDLLETLAGKSYATKVPADLGHLIPEVKKALGLAKRAFAEDRTEHSDTLTPVPGQANPPLRPLAMLAEIDEDLHSRLQRIRILRNRGAHANREPCTQDDALESLRHLHEVSRWYIEEVHQLTLDPVPSGRQPKVRLVSSPPPPMLEEPAVVAAPSRWWRWVLPPVGAAALLIAGWLQRPRVDAMMLEEQPDGRYALVLSGALGRAWWLWQGSWLASLKARKTGVEPQGSLERLADGSARVILAVSPEFDARTLPVPTLPGSSGAEVPLQFRFRLRVAVVRYKAFDAKETEDMFALLGQQLAQSSLLRGDKIEFAPTPTLIYHTTAEFEGENPEPTLQVLRESDAVYTSVFLQIAMRAHVRATQGNRTIQPTESDAPAPFDWIACNVGHDGSLTYSSAMFTRADSALAAAFPEGKLVTQESFQRYLDLLPEEQQVTVHYGSTHSTSGYVLPCLTWHKLFHHPRVGPPVHAGEHRRTIEQVQARPRELGKEIHLGFAYRELLEKEMQASPGVPLRLLWESERIPHGGLFLTNAAPAIKRRALQRGVSHLFEEHSSGKQAIPWPAMTDIHGLDKCERANFNQLEYKIFHAPGLPVCLPQLASKLPPAPP